MAMPATISRPEVAECVRRSDGVLLTGGEDIDPRIYSKTVSDELRNKITVTADGGRRDFRELLLIDEVFRQRKPLLAICRGHQVVNVALGGTLVADIRSEMPRALDHRQLNRRSQVVHEVQLTGDSFLAKITGKRKLGVNSTHHQAVARVAPLLQVAATSSDSVIESLELKPGAAHLLPFLLTVQFHPERLAGRHAEHQAIFGAFTDACGRSNNL
jgi:putative glutamine amidotransferase